MSAREGARARARRDAASPRPRAREFGGGRSTWTWNPPEERSSAVARGVAMCAASVIALVLATASAVGDLGATARAETGIEVIDWALRDAYYSRVVPALIPGTIAYAYFHWLSARFFEHT